VINYNDFMKINKLSEDKLDFNKLME